MASVAELQQDIIGDYIFTAANAVYFYEYVITLCEEVNVIWRRKWTTMTWIYAITRYSTLLLNISTFGLGGNTISSCKGSIYTQNILILISFPCFALFSALRVYALSDDRCIMAGLVFLLNMVPFATNMFDFITEQFIMDSEICSNVLTGSAGLNLFLTLISRISVIIGDILVLVVTWMKTAQSYNEARRLKMKAPLSRMLIRDGTLYFAILLIMNVLEVFGDIIPILVALDAVEPFFDIVSPMIICHFILNLRQVKLAGDSWVSGNQSHSLRVVGNMGESLRFGGDEEEDDDDEVEFEGDVHAAAADDLPTDDLPTEASNTIEANEGEAGSHSDYGIEEVPAHYDA